MAGAPGLADHPAVLVVAPGGKVPGDEWVQTVAEYSGTALGRMRQSQQIRARETPG